MGVRSLNKKLIAILTAIGIILLIGTLYLFGNRNIQKVGILFEGSPNEQPWDQKGYDGLLTIGEEFDADIYIKENIKTKEEVERAVKYLVEKEVRIIFGHSHSYGRYFADLAETYPHTKFVYFNGGYTADNVTSLNFESHGMGFFGGMVAGKMTETNEIGIIAAYEWQPEVEGFYEGVKFQNPDASVHINYVNDWGANEIAMQMYETMKDNGVDVFYPTGDSFSNEIVEQADKDDLYAIGYVSNQPNIDEHTMLTSTIQHVDALYVIVAELYEENNLTGGIMTFDFADDAISLGEFSPDVPIEYKEYVMELVDEYIETGLLPNEQYQD